VGEGGKGNQKLARCDTVRGPRGDKEKTGPTQEKQQSSTFATKGKTGTWARAPTKKGGVQTELPGQVKANRNWKAKMRTCGEGQAREVVPAYFRPGRGRVTEKAGGEYWTIGKKKHGNPTKGGCGTREDA